MEFISQEELNNMQFHSIEALQEFLNQKKEAHNNKADPQFSDISPMQMYRLLHNPFSAESPLVINQVDDDVFEKMPFFLTLEHLLQIVVREKAVKLTPKGNLPLKICQELADKRYWKEELSDLYKQRKEEDFQVIHAAKIIGIIGGLLRKANGKLNVTKQAQKFLEKKDRNALFVAMFQPFMSKFNWGYFDLYTSQGTGILAWAYSIYILQKFGETPQLLAFYADKYFTAFPRLIEDFQDRSYSTPQEQALNCYTLRTFIRYFNWFGFIHFPEGTPSFGNKAKPVLKTSVVDALFSFRLD
jgi:hypothetical protein